jgi:Rod binding domain-containing protein
MNIVSSNMYVVKPIETYQQKNAQEVVQNFESLMTFEMVKSMAKTVSLGEKGFASEFVQSLFEETCTKAISSQKGIGLSEVLMRQMGF